MTPDQPGDPWVAVAVFQRPHGLRGETRLRPLTRSADELLDAPAGVLHARRGGRIDGPFTIAEARVHDGLLYAFFDQIADRTAAEAFTNAELVVREADLWPPTGGGHYVFQLEGLEVRDADSGAVLGRVRTAREGAAQDLLVLELSSAPGRETLLPITPGFVPEIDTRAGFVRVRIPEGLLEL